MITASDPLAPFEQLLTRAGPPRFDSLSDAETQIDGLADGQIVYIATSKTFYGRVDGQWVTLRAPDRVVAVAGTGGMSGSFTAVRRGSTVSLYGSLEGTPSDPQSSVVAAIPLGWRPRAAFKTILGSSGVGPSNRNVRLVGFTGGGEVHLSWSGAFGDSTPSTGGSNLHFAGVTYETADA